jgi:hypothetical protein
MRTLSPRTPYVLSLLKPTSEYPLDSAEMEAALRHVTGGRLGRFPAGDYAVVAGLTEEAPALARGSDRPFRTRLRLDGVPIDIRMDSWLAFDTFRRMGFGHVVAGRHHALIIERGLNFVALDATGAPVTSGYLAGIYEPEARYLVRP